MRSGDQVEFEEVRGVRDQSMEQKASVSVFIYVHIHG